MSYKMIVEPIESSPVDKSKITWSTIYDEEKQLRYLKLEIGNRIILILNEKQTNELSDIIETWNVLINTVDID